jgi:cytochrome o ubiquinol oxidase subunit 3
MENDEKIFGFWLYLMTDLVIFAVLFACYLVLQDPTSAHKLFHLSTVIQETVILLTSSFTCALGMLAVQEGKKKPAIAWFAGSFALGVAFLVLELSEFSQFIYEGDSWRRSGFLSSFFTLVGTHGLHISVGLLWMAVAMFRIWFRPLVASSVSRIFRMAMFWHFLDFIWIFIFTVVYGMGLL